MSGKTKYIRSKSTDTQHIDPFQNLAIWSGRNAKKAKTKMAKKYWQDRQAEMLRSKAKTKKEIEKRLKKRGFSGKITRTGKRATSKGK